MTGKERLLGILYPRVCPICGEIVLSLDGETAEHETKDTYGAYGIWETHGTSEISVQKRVRYACPECRKKVSFVTEPRCKKCGKAIVQETKEYCRDCAKSRRSFVQGIVLASYTPEVRHALSAVKYGNLRQHLDFFCQELVELRGREIRGWEAEVLIPVPLHPSKRRQRGFNQAEEICVRLSRLLGISVDTKVLYRGRKTAPQKDLNDRQRLANLVEAFGVYQDAVRYGRVILVDDIYTTGSTVEACTRVLLRAGVEEVYVVCLAAGVTD